MEQNDLVNLYTMTKDIIIPFLGILSTVIIGVFITLALKNREEKSKIKQLLIDHYMSFLSVYSKNLQEESINLKLEIFNDIIINSDLYFKGNANHQHPFKLIKEKYDLLKNKESNDGNHWSFYTFRFTFLLGKKSILNIFTS